ncbi:MAG: hypothetical protein GY719_32785 [bacterium]|nr:hypothetical protein [bacterium]
MRPLELSFRSVLTISFSVISMLLYVAASLIILGFQTRHGREDLHVLLYSEAEGLAGYIASTDRLDYPELVAFEDETPLPIWLRVFQGSRVIASTPEIPVVPVPPADVEEGRLTMVETADGVLASVQHQVWNRPGMRVEALARRELLDARRRNLLFTLLLTGLILLPLSAGAGRLLARYALRPVESLVVSIGAMDPRHLSGRLTASGSVREISDLAAEFNSLLERFETTVENMKRFTANASHELRTPIASLRTGIEVTLRRDRHPEEYRSLLTESLQEIDRMQRVVEGLMALARETADVEPPREPVDLGEVVRLSDRTMRPLAEEKQLRLITSAADALVVPGNADQLQLMLINLIDNAIRHSPGGSEIRVDATLQDGHGRVMVSDEGPGIPPEDRPHIFDRHFQGGGRAGARRTGGIGLDLVRWVVEVHRGTIRLLDEVETGARFEILLPLAGPKASPPSA